MIKKLIYAIVLAIPFLGLALETKAATSTVMLDAPDIADMINKIYLVAQPVFNSISGWIWVFLGFAFVFFVVRFLIGIFNK